MDIVSAKLLLRLAKSPRIQLRLTKKTVNKAVGDLADIVSESATNVDKRFGAMDKRFDRIDVALAEHTSQISDLQVSTIRVVNKLDDIEGRLLALENDIKDIYKMLATQQTTISSTSKFKSKPLEGQVLEAYKSILQIAKDAGIKLPTAL